MQRCAGYHQHHPNQREQLSPAKQLSTGLLINFCQLIPPPESVQGRRIVAGEGSAAVGFDVHDIESGKFGPPPKPSPPVGEGVRLPITHAHRRYDFY